MKRRSVTTYVILLKKYITTCTHSFYGMQSGMLSNFMLCDFITISFLLVNN